LLDGEVTGLPHSGSSRRALPHAEVVTAPLLPQRALISACPTFGCPSIAGRRRPTGEARPRVAAPNAPVKGPFSQGFGNGGAFARTERDQEGEGYSWRF
jgi:hypothetical protein